jgi:hypothetical protein
MWAVVADNEIVCTSLLTPKDTALLLALLQLLLAGWAVPDKLLCCFLPAGRR